MHQYSEPTSYTAAQHRHRRTPRLLRIAAAAMLSAAAIAAAPVQLAQASDLGGNCCADLEERIAELEATTAHKGNRKVSLTISGQVNKALLVWDDGHESDTYVVDNVNGNTLFALSGDAKFAPGWTAGYVIEIWVNDNFSDGVSQNSDEAGSGFTVWQSNWYIENERAGRITVGQAPRASDGAPEVDLSEAGDASYSGIPDIGGGFALRTNAGSLANSVWGDLTGNFNGDVGALVRYDSQAFAGLTLVATWGEDDIWDVAGFYEGEGRGFKVGAAIAYTETSDETGTDGEGDVPNSTTTGSFSILHVSSGLNFTVAGGYREFDAKVEDSDGNFRAPADAAYIYAKLGWLAELNKLGPTAFYGEYGHYKDFLSAGLDAAGVASLSFTDEANVCAAAGDACRVTASKADIWGVGVVQHIEAAEMQVYLGYRHWSADVDLADAGGDAVTEAALEDFDTVIAGSRISF